MINLTDKHGLLKQFKDEQLNKTLTMFNWSNLPDTLPAVELEKMLQINGYAVIAKYQGKVYAFQGGFSGQDVYNQPTQVIVNNPALKNNNTYTIDEDCVVIKNDDMKQGLVKAYEYYGQLLIENQITMLMTDYNLRMPFTISSSDDQTTQSAQEYLNKIIDGSLGVIGEQKLFKALSVTPTSSKQTSTFADLYGYQQFITAQLNNEIGLATNNNMKRERLTTNEIEVNKNASYPLVDNMLKNRQMVVAKINEMFDLDIDVEYGSIWGSDDDTEPDDTEPTEPEDDQPDDDHPDNDQPDDGQPDDDQPEDDKPEDDKPDDDQPDDDQPDDDQPEDDQPDDDQPEDDQPDDDKKKKKERDKK